MPARHIVELGVGIGGLATYAQALGADVIPVDIGIRHQMDIWMTYHPDVRSVKRVATFTGHVLADHPRAAGFASISPKAVNVESRLRNLANSPSILDDCQESA
jgi:hypothetical protein